MRSRWWRGGNKKMIFEWDEEKNLLNIKKHGISFQEAVVVFTDEHILERYDNRHSTLYEERYIGIGKMRSGITIMFVVYTERPGVIRIISARKAEPEEEKAYYDSYYDA
jgi:uncharacterized DUF497 family protein